jgi:hypothetical protein
MSTAAIRAGFCVSPEACAGWLHTSCVCRRSPPRPERRAVPAAPARQCHDGLRDRQWPSVARCLGRIGLPDIAFILYFRVFRNHRGFRAEYLVRIPQPVATTRQPYRRGAPAAVGPASCRTGRGTEAEALSPQLPSRQRRWWSAVNRGPANRGVRPTAVRPTAVRQDAGPTCYLYFQSADSRIALRFIRATVIAPPQR